MNTLLMIAFIAAFACLNRGRGSQFWDRIPSTTAGRLLATFGMAVLTAGAAWPANPLAIFIWTWATLFIWTVFAWDKYWAAAIGHTIDPTARAFPPVDWVMSELPAMPLRMWGTVAMGLRQSLLTLSLVGLAIIAGHPDRAAFAPLTLLFGIPYLLAGYSRTPYPIGWAEYTVGAAIGALCLLVAC